MDRNEKLALLQKAIENGMLDEDAIYQQIKMKEREQILALNPYKPYQSGGSWYVYLPGDEKRILKKRKSLKELEDVIISFWKRKQENPTIEALFQEWILAKFSREEISKTTKDRYERQFTQCFKTIKDVNVKSITDYDLEEFILNVIYQEKLTSKGFGNFRTLCFGIFKLAKKKKYISFSVIQVFEELEISKNAFREDIKSDEDQVFTEEETPIIVSYLEEHADVKNLGLLLTFKSGVRVGELAALKKEDVRENVLHVCRTEIRYDGEEKGTAVYEVRNRPKTKAGIRDVVLSDKAMPILKRIEQMSSNGEWLFEIQGERVLTYQFRNRLRWVCKKVGIKPKSPHKIRKEVATAMLDHGVPEGMIMTQLGHTDIQTTKTHYYRNRKSEAEKKRILNEIEEL